MPVKRKRAAVGEIGRQTEVGAIGTKGEIAASEAVNLDEVGKRTSRQKPHGNKVTKQLEELNSDDAMRPKDEVMDMGIERRDLVQLRKSTRTRKAVEEGVKDKAAAGRGGGEKQETVVLQGEEKGATPVNNDSNKSTGPKQKPKKTTKASRDQQSEKSGSGESDENGLGRGGSNEKEVQLRRSTRTRKSTEEDVVKRGGRKQEMMAIQGEEKGATLDDNNNNSNSNNKRTGQKQKQKEMEASRGQSEDSLGDGREKQMARGVEQVGWKGKRKLSIILEQKQGADDEEEVKEEEEEVNEEMRPAKMVKGRIAQCDPKTKVLKKGEKTEANEKKDYVEGEDEGKEEEEVRTTKTGKASAGRAARKITRGRKEGKEKVEVIMEKVHVAGEDGKEQEEEEEEEEVEQEEEVVLVASTQTDKAKRAARGGRKSTRGRKEGQESMDVVRMEKVYVDDHRPPWQHLVHKKAEPDWIAYDPTTMRRSLPTKSSISSSLHEPKNNGLKILSWNVNGLRSLIKDKDTCALTQLAEREGADVVCLQETKMQDKNVEEINALLSSKFPSAYWTCSTAKLGYSGCAVLCKQPPISVKYGLGDDKHDKEGRLITVEFADFFLVTCYVPNSGDKLVRLQYREQEWDPFLSQYLKGLETTKPVILTGDLNCAHQEIDIYHPEGNRRSAGFTDEERRSFEANFLHKGFADSFRQQHPKAVAYTYWAARSRARSTNRGWRLDYFLISEALLPRVHDSYTLPDVLGSDHCPIGLTLLST